MTQEQKDLLLKDLCARVPYGVKVRSKIPINQNESKEFIGQVTSVHYNVSIVQVGGFDVIADYNPYFEIKPYLFPLSSVSEDQKYDFYCRFIKNDCNFDDFKKFLYDGMWRRKLLTFTSLYDIEAIIDWFHKNHIDYRDLIPMGLAIDATGKNIY